MRDSSQENLTVLTSFMVSLLLNGAALFWVDQAVSPEGTSFPRFANRPVREKEESIQFEFVEAPPVPSAARLEKTRKIAEHDSKAKDRAVGSLKKDAAPKTAALGRSDQLAQKPGPPPKPVPAGRAETKASPSKPYALSDRDALVEVRRRKRHQPAGTTQPMPQISGEGKIITQEMSKTKSRGAKFSGQTSFEATGSGMGAYMKRLKEKIWAQWFPYVAFKFPRNFKTADAVVEFTLDPQGRVKSSKIIDSKGSPVFAVFCLEAIRQAQGFGDLPKEILDLLGEKELTISFAFHYN